MDGLNSYKEENLTKEFCYIIENEKTPWGDLNFTYEFNHRSGRTDVIAADEFYTLYAFEMKLIKWKQALNQAYRNTSFANKSYVVLPEKTARKAVYSKSDFLECKVGLCTLDGSALKILIEAEFQEPLFPWLSTKALENIKKRNG